MIEYHLTYQQLLVLLLLAGFSIIGIGALIMLIRNALRDERYRRRPR
jgi:hypothetical protein